MKFKGNIERSLKSIRGTVKHLLPEYENYFS
jgi:hypothetical protein